jgi:predicted nucleic acid-binding protein
MANVLIDAGPLVALFAENDVHHTAVDDFLRREGPRNLRLLTTWFCLCEAAYLLNAPLRCELLQWIARGGAQIYSCEPHHLPDMIGWMQRYTERGKRQMDLADASLYWLAVETNITEILTVDWADFSRYRLPDGRAFNLLLDRPATSP